MTLTTFLVLALILLGAGLASLALVQILGSLVMLGGLLALWLPGHLPPRER